MECCEHQTSTRTQSHVRKAGWCSSRVLWRLPTWWKGKHLDLSSRFCRRCVLGRALRDVSRSPAELSVRRCLLHDKHMPRPKQIDSCECLDWPRTEISSSNAEMWCAFGASPGTRDSTKTTKISREGNCSRCDADTAARLLNRAVAQLCSRSVCSTKCAHTLSPRVLGTSSLEEYGTLELGHRRRSGKKQRSKCDSYVWQYDDSPHR